LTDLKMPNAAACSIRLRDLALAWTQRMELCLAGHNARLAKGHQAWCNSWMQAASGPDREIIALADSAIVANAADAAGLADTADTDDIRATLAGDGTAYDRLAKRHQTQIANTMWRFTQDRQQHEELVQDVFVEGYLSLRTFTAAAPLLHWLQRIATRTGYRYWKRQQKRRCETAWTKQHEQLAARDAAQLTDQEAAEFVQRILAELAPRDRLVLTLVYLEQRNTNEVADLTGWSRSLVKVQLHRARKRLAKICKQKGIEL